MTKTHTTLAAAIALTLAGATAHAADPGNLAMEK